MFPLDPPPYTMELRQHDGKTTWDSSEPGSDTAAAGTVSTHEHIVQGGCDQEGEQDNESKESEDEELEVDAQREFVGLDCVSVLSVLSVPSV